MNKWFSALGVGLLATISLVLTLAYTQSMAQGESDYAIFLPLIRQDHPLPVIDYFEANTTLADPGDTIELSWGTTDAVSVTLYHLLPTGQFGTFWDVAPMGTMTYTISFLARNHSNFMLFASNAAGQWTSASLQVVLTCPDAWFFSPEPPICSTGPAAFGAGAEQHFEHGMMVWVQSQDLIYVLFDDGQPQQWYPYLDEWEAGMPVSDPMIIPPAGFFQPERGFGLVWREQTAVRDRLGWALDRESSYETAVQRTSASYSDTYIRAADGNVWRLMPEFSGWEKIIVDP